MLVVGIEQEVEREPFDVCLIFQNRVVQENKRDPVFPRPQTERSSAIVFFSSSFICKVLETKTVSKDANGANTFRISSGSALLSQIHVVPIGLRTDNINACIDNFTGGKTRHGSCFKERRGISRFRISSYIRISEYICSCIACYSSSGLEIVCFKPYTIRP